jgi:hypothetical protein
VADVIKISAPGIAEVIRDINTYSAKTQALIQAELKASVQTMVRNAKRDAPKDMGNLAGGVNYKEVNPTLFEYFSQAEYSGYDEFGTKSRRRIPPEVQKLGIQFSTAKSTGTAEQALKFITAWVKRKGIRFESASVQKGGKKAGKNKLLSYEQTAYFIFHHIMLVGIKPRPFFFPALLNETPLLQRRLEQIINNNKI